MMSDKYATDAMVIWMGASYMNNRCAVHIHERTHGLLYECTLEVLCDACENENGHTYDNAKMMKMKGMTLHE